MLTKIRYGNTNTVLLQGDKGSILIDTDYAGTMPAFYKTIKGLGIKVSDITYEDNKKLKADWDALLSAGPKRIIYAHANERSFYPDDIITLSEA